MIVTVTPNPSIDRTAELDRALDRGGVHRLAAPTDVAGGKGINVARVLHRASVATIAIVPAPEQHALLVSLADEGIPFARTDAPGVRTNLTLVEHDGTTTKLNEPGAALSPAEVQQLERAAFEAAGVAASAGLAAAGGVAAAGRAGAAGLATAGLDAAGLDAAAGLASADPASAGPVSADTWVVLAGSLPSGLPADWYVSMTARLHAAGVRVAVDTSDEPIRAFAQAAVLPDFMKPNGLELAMLAGEDRSVGERLEALAESGDFAPACEAATAVYRRGCGTVLVTLGAAGAVLVTAGGAWAATPPPITPRSTVGAGDSSLAGYLRGVVTGLEPAERLRLAVAAGSAAASLPGTGVPGPEDLDLAQTEVRLLTTDVD